MTSIDDLTPLTQVPAGTEWLTEEADGSLKFRDASTYRRGEKAKLNPAARVALGLNQTFKKRRMGKVYTYVPAEMGIEEDSHIDATIHFRAVAELFYVNEAWTDDDVDLWDKSEPADLLDYMDGRHGWVTFETPVVEFALELHEVLRERPTFDSLSQVPLLLLIGPQPYIGLQKHMRVDSSRNWVTGANDSHPTGNLFVNTEKTWEDVEQWRVQGAQGIVDKFESILGDAGVNPEYEDCVVLFGTMVQRFILAGKAAADAGQPYGKMEDLSEID